MIFSDTLFFKGLQWWDTWRHGLLTPTGHQEQGRSGGNALPIKSRATATKPFGHFLLDEKTLSFKLLPLRKTCVVFLRSRTYVNVRANQYAYQHQ